MCRLYALSANEPTRVECGLVHAQNALMEQSRRDAEGLVHGHGWGVADYPDGVPIIEKQTWAAYHGEHFRKKAARVYARTVIAHVRRATVGVQHIDNTHPFAFGRYIFAHNGTVPNFELLRPRLLSEIDPVHRNHIRGDTDSEHVFMFLMTRWSHGPQHDLLATLCEGLEDIIAWSAEIDPARPVGLNVVLSDGDELVGSRLNRTLWSLERHAIPECDICGRPHVHHEPGQAYRSIEVASEPFTHGEPWLAVDNGVGFRAMPGEPLEVRPLRPNTAARARKTSA